MNKHITQNDLILLAYNELPKEIHNEMISRVLQNEKMAKEYAKIKSQMELLDTLFQSPNDTTVNIVTEESCSFGHLETI